MGMFFRLDSKYVNNKIKLLINLFILKGALADSNSALPNVLYNVLLTVYDTSYCSNIMFGKKATSVICAGTSIKKYLFTEAHSAGLYFRYICLSLSLH